MFTVYVLLLTLLAKLCSKDTRGTMFFFAGLVGSVSIMSMHGLGGFLYGHYSKDGPFIFAFVFYAIFSLTNLILGFLGKLHV